MLTKSDSIELGYWYYLLPDETWDIYYSRCSDIHFLNILIHKILYKKLLKNRILK